MAYVAWDIETCPLPSETLPSTQQERLGSEVERLREQSPGEDEEALHRQAGSFHPHLEWIKRKTCSTSSERMSTRSAAITTRAAKISSGSHSTEKFRCALLDLPYGRKRTCTDAGRHHAHVPLQPRATRRPHRPVAQLKLLAGGTLQFSRCRPPEG